MKKISKYKVEMSILIPLILFCIISITTIYSTQIYLDESSQNLYLKQLLWYGIGFIVSYFMMNFGNKFFYNTSYILYGIGVLLLVLVLFFGKTINYSRCWFIFGSIAFQPSEFMKVILILVLAKMIEDFHIKYPNPTIEEEFKFILKALIITFIPSILTFIQPDTGAVIIYLIVMVIMLFISGIRKRWFIMAFCVLLGLSSIFFALFFFQKELFIDIFGTSFFYRIDRIMNWSSGSGMQLTNSITAIGSAGMFGHGFNQIPLYFPELQTDFIFASFASMYGFVGTTAFLLLIIFFDINLINTAKKAYDNTNKYAMAGILGILIYQQIQNIGMTLGLLPITGITLPFISYGGSSLLSYMILVGLIFNISNESLRYTN